LGIYVVVIAWLYVVLMMAVAEALSSQGTVLGAVFTFLLYGVLPLSIVVYILGTPLRKRARARQEAQAAAVAAAAPASTDRAGDGGAEAAEPVAAAERKEA
jgi:mannose/fructose/N-acetylgalactosamine-specific phosphotransferase system component IID